MTDEHDSDGLEDVFARTRAATPAPRPAFVERLMADALSAMPASPPARWGWRDVLGALGGWSAGGALGGAALAGLAVGYFAAPPAGEPLEWGDETAVAFLEAGE